MNGCALAATVRRSENVLTLTMPATRDRQRLPAAPRPRADVEDPEEMTWFSRGCRARAEVLFLVVAVGARVAARLAVSPRIVGDDVVALRQHAGTSPSTTDVVGDAVQGDDHAPCRGAVVRKRQPFRVTPPAP